MFYYFLPTFAPTLRMEPEPRSCNYHDARLLQAAKQGTESTVACSIREHGGIGMGRPSKS